VSCVQGLAARRAIGRLNPHFADLPLAVRFFAFEASIFTKGHVGKILPRSRAECLVEFWGVYTGKPDFVLLVARV